MHVYILNETSIHFLKYLSIYKTNIHVANIYTHYGQTNSRECVKISVSKININMLN